MSRYFSCFSDWVSTAAGSPWAFMLAALSVLVWFVYGLLFGFTDTVQLVINTATTIVTFLMVFLIQSTQNRQEEALHKKIDDLIAAIPAAHDELIGIEKETR